MIETTHSGPPVVLDRLVGDPVVAQVRRRMAAFLVERGGRCTRQQWIRELSLTKKWIADLLTVEMVRKTKTHCIANDSGQPRLAKTTKEE